VYPSETCEDVQVHVRDSKRASVIGMFRAMLVMTALGLCLALAGCGQSGSSEVPPPVETTTVLELNFDL